MGYTTNRRFHVYIYTWIWFSWSGRIQGLPVPCVITYCKTQFNRLIALENQLQGFVTKKNIYIFVLFVYAMSICTNTPELHTFVSSKLDRTVSQNIGVGYVKQKTHYFAEYPQAEHVFYLANWETSIPFLA